MSPWNQIPNEILQTIMQLVIDNKALYQCLYVNKQWLTISQSIMYRDISIYLEEENKLFKAITTSTSEPGKWVKTIRLYGLVTPSIDSFNFLNLIITHCPDVKSIRTYSHFFDWRCFLHILIKNGNWKRLQSFSKYNNYNGDYINYFECLYYLRDSLKELHLTRRISFNYNQLGTFNRLIQLKVDKGVLHNLIDLDSLLEHFPNILYLKVSFYQLQKNINNNINRKPHDSNLAELEIIDCNPLNRQELQILKEYRNLKKLTIAFINLDSTFVFPLFTLLCNIERYDIQFKTTGQFSIMNIIRQILKHQTKDTFDNLLSVYFSPDTLDAQTSEIATRFKIYNTTPNGKMNLHLIYSMKYDMENQSEIARQVVTESLSYFGKCYIHIDPALQEFYPSLTEMRDLINSKQ